ncbi:MAG: hypothetical protein L0I76_17515 [Pseudonocardia sp.]|nr:hypothetical protein [Pseudonocardia sp.]
MVGPEVVDVLAQQLSTGRLRDWIADNLITLAVALVGVVLLFASMKQQMSKVVTVVGGLMIGLAVVGLAFVPDGPSSTATFLWGLVSGT